MTSPHTAVRSDPTCLQLLAHSDSVNLTDQFGRDALYYALQDDEWFVRGNIYSKVHLPPQNNCMAYLHDDVPPISQKMKSKKYYPVEDCLFPDLAAFPPLHHPCCWPLLTSVLLTCDCVYYCGGGVHLGRNYQNEKDFEWGYPNGLYLFHCMEEVL